MNAHRSTPRTPGRASVLPVRPSSPNIALITRYHLENPVKPVGPAASHRARSVLTATAVASTCALFSMSPASAGVIDPSAYGVTANGPVLVGARPAVDWTAGAPLTAVSGPITALTARAVGAVVSAGDGFATAQVIGLRYGQLDIRSLTSTCRSGHTSVAVSGTDGALRLSPGESLTLPGGAQLQIGLTESEPDGSTSVIGAQLLIPTPSGPEQLSIAKAQCGAHS